MLKILKKVRLFTNIILKTIEISPTRIPIYFFSPSVSEIYDVRTHLKLDLITFNGYRLSNGDTWQYYDTEGSLMLGLGEN